MRINGVYITNEQVKEAFFSDKKLSNIFRTLYIANLVIFVLLVIFQIAVAILEDQSSIRIVVLGFILISACFLATSIMEYLARKKQNIKLIIGTVPLTIIVVVFGILSLAAYIGVVIWIAKNSCGTDEDEECIAAVSCAAVLCVVSLGGVIVNIFGCCKITPFLSRNPKLQEIVLRSRGGASINLDGEYQPPVAGYTAGYPSPPTGTTNEGEHTGQPSPALAYDNPVELNEDWQRMEADKAALANEGLPEKKIDTYPA